MTAPIRIALVGMGKIARDQHVPAIEASPSFRLEATVSRRREPVGHLPHFESIEALARSDVRVDAVALCTPPQVRRPLAETAIRQGWHVFLEKPPGSTLSEVIALRDAAAERGISLFASWHSRYADGVEPARAWLARRAIRSVTITWREDVRVWHPGQDWIWQAGGLGVFDPGINALSILTRILPRPVFVKSADLYVPENKAAPIAARVSFEDSETCPIEMDLDFRQEGPQSWDIVVETDDGTLTLSAGGAHLALSGAGSLPDRPALSGEYPGLYRQFADLISSARSDVDVAPLRLVGDIFMMATFHRVDPFVE